jgi:hypothetical protein
MDYSITFVVKKLECLDFLFRRLLLHLVKNGCHLSMQSIYFNSLDYLFAYLDTMISCFMSKNYYSLFGLQTN